MADIDYNALAAQYGGTDATDGPVDYDALASEYGGVSDGEAPGKKDESWLAREGRLTFGIGGDADLRSSVIGRTMEGMARPAAGITQLVTGGSPAVTEAINRRRTQAESALSPDETNVAGYVGEALSPTTMIPALKLAPYTVAGNKLLGRAAQGAGVGAATAMATPVIEGNFDEEKSKQALLGFAVGGLVPPAMAALWKLGGVGYRVAIEPWLDPASIKGRALLAAAGDKADEVIELLKGNRQIVKGSMPTAGEAAVPAGSTGFSALQRSASQVPGEAADAYVARTDTQNAARIAGLRGIGQDEAALNAAAAERSRVTTPMYEAAREAGDVDISQVVGQIDDLMQKNPGNPALMATFGQIRAGLTDGAGKIRTNTQEIASALDGIKAALANKDNAFIQKQLTQIKNQLSDAIPGYEAAQGKFAELSAPVNQMQIGQYLEKKLVPALDEQGKQKAAAFAQAVEDAPGTVKRATGAPRFEKLSDALTPEQMGIVNSVQQDLARLERLGTLSRAAKGGPNAIDLATQSAEGITGGRLPNILNRTAMIMNAIITRAEGKINKKLAAELAAEMLDPPQAAKSMEQAQKIARKNKAISEVLLKYRNVPNVVAGQSAANDQ